MWNIAKICFRTFGVLVGGGRGGFYKMFVQWCFTTKCIAHQKPSSKCMFFWNLLGLIWRGAEGVGILHKYAASWWHHHPHDLLQNVFPLKLLLLQNDFWLFKSLQMMPSMAATKWFASLGHVPKKTHKTTLGYKMQWPKVSIFPKNWLKKGIYTEHRSMHSVVEMASRIINNHQ